MFLIQFLTLLTDTEPLEVSERFCQKIHPFGGTKRIKNWIGNTDGLCHHPCTFDHSNTCCFQTKSG